MKKLALVALLALSTLSSFAQDDKIKEAALKKIAKSDADIENPKKMGKFNTWLSRADVFIDAGIAYTNKLVADLPVAQITMPGMAGQPKAIQEVEFFGQPYSKYVYENFDMFVNSAGVVSFWEARAEAYPDAFGEALNALEKAKEVDEVGFMKAAKTKSTIFRLASELNTIGRNFYTVGKYAEGGAAFQKAYEANLLVGTTDTLSMYYSALCYFEAKEFEKSEKIFANMLDIKAYEGGMTIYYLSECQKNLDKKTEYIKTLEDGFELFPENSTIMGGLINAYMTENENPDKLIDLIKKAQALDTENISLLLVESQIWEKIGKLENAYLALEKALEKDPKSMHANYNYAVFKIMESDNLVAKAGKLDFNDVATYDAMMAEVETKRREAITQLEKCLELDPENQDVIGVLRQMLFICRNYEGIQAKLEEFNAANPAQ